MAGAPAAHRVPPRPGVRRGRGRTGFRLTAALRATGVAALAAGSSAPAAGATLGPAALVHRHPTDVHTDATAWERRLGAYDRRYAGKGISAPDARRFLDAECTIVLPHVLSGDPAHTSAHQSDLTGDRVLLGLADHVLGR